MSEQENRDAIGRYLKAFEQCDLDAIAELMHDDCVEEFPQSGERIRGKQDARSVLENFPGGLPNLLDHSYVVSGDLSVMKMTLEYGGNRVYACEVIDFQAGKIKRVRAYFWRAVRGTGVAGAVGRKYGTVVLYSRDLLRKPYHLSAVS